MLKLSKELGDRIRALRKAAGATQEELGEKAGLSYKFLGELERGQVNVSLGSLEKISTALGVQVGDLFYKEQIPAQKVFTRVFTKENLKLSRLSLNDLRLIKKALRLLEKIF